MKYRIRKDLDNKYIPEYNGGYRTLWHWDEVYDFNGVYSWQHKDLTMTEENAKKVIENFKKRMSKKEEIIEVK